jgi:hypothetical protein
MPAHSQSASADRVGNDGPGDFRAPSLPLIAACELLMRQVGRAEETAVPMQRSRHSPDAGPVTPRSAGLWDDGYGCTVYLK